MDKAYTPGDIERRIYERWETSGAFAPSGDGEPYCIMLPPPNVTGTLHMGHAFQQTLMDTLSRWHRMRGFSVLWQTGTDHAGIATQMVVERQLAAEGIHRLDLGRERFLERVWAWKEQSGGTITNQMRRLGDSVDWSRDAFTMSPELSRAVTEEFVRLYEDELIYRGKRLVNWDPVLQTAVSDLEVVSEEENGSLWHIRYPIVGGGGHVVVATTRPETMLGDTAVAVNPDDERYQSLVGKQLELPLTGRTIPVIADNYVDAAFGSGCVKITPAHDFNDYEVGQLHNLPQINIFMPDAKLNDNAPEPYRGLDRFEARKKIVADLEAAGLIEKIEPHKLKVPHGDRTNAVIEPYLTDQWYVKIESLAAPALKAVEDGTTKFVPENWTKTYYEWMRNIKDWCVSRQLWWGHRIPAWYGPLVPGHPAHDPKRFATATIFVARNEADAIAQAREYYRAANLEFEIETTDDFESVRQSIKDVTSGKSKTIKISRDPDVLDTWFSSALWPFSTLGWPGTTPELQRFYPSNVLVTGFDIIFFWVARMMMMGLKFMKDVPFERVYITGLIRDEHGEKMSKTKGNVIDPLDIVDGISLEDLIAKRTSGLMQPQMKQRIEKNTRKQFPDGISAHGTDALRFTLASLAGPSRDINFDLARVGGYRNFCNKLWNAARFVLMTVEGQGEMIGEAELSVADRWIVSRFAKSLGQFNEALKDYRFDLAATALYEFTWREYCDWYLELTKPVLQGDSATEAQKRGTRRTLVTTLEALLRALHPMMPFITEEIWQRVNPLVAPLTAAVNRRATTKSPDMLMLAPFPSASDFASDNQADDEVESMKLFVILVRGLRSQLEIAPSTRAQVFLQGGSAGESGFVTRHSTYLCRLAGLSGITLLGSNQTAPVSLKMRFGSATIHLPLEGNVDLVPFGERLTRKIAKNEAERAKLMAKHKNVEFMKNAPPTVIASDQERMIVLEVETASFRTNLELVHSLTSDAQGK